MSIVIREGTTIEPSMQADIDYVEEHFRDGDRAEHLAMGGGRTKVSMFEDCWTVRYHGEIIGYCGIAIPADESPFGDTRWFCFMSCTNANKHKIAFVKGSRLVLKRVAAMMPTHVRYIQSLPSADYTASLKWHERVLGMQRKMILEYQGQKFVLYFITREELEK